MIRYITYKKTKLPVRISYFALKMLKAETSKPLTELKDDDYEAYETLLYYALMQGHKKAEKEFTIKREEIEDIMDECFFEFIALVPVFFSQNKPEEEKTKTTKEQASKKLMG